MFFFLTWMTGVIMLRRSAASDHLFRRGLPLLFYAGFVEHLLAHLSLNTLTIWRLRLRNDP
jgi:hypothetical protein